MGYLNSKRLKYWGYMITVIILILAVFNVFITIFIHKKLARIASRPGRWPVGAYVYDPKIGFDFAPNISGKIGDGSYYVKSHQFGYRISEREDPVAWQPGGVLSLGCSFTYGDEVESNQTFTQLAADSLDLPAYNYGICSFSYIHALLKAEKLKEQGVLDKLRPKYVILGCWSGLPDRSRTPFPPLGAKSLPMPAAYLAREGSDLTIEYPLKAGNVFKLVKLYREEGTKLTTRKFFKIFTSAPRIVSLYIKNNRLAKQLRERTFQNNVTDYEVYDFYFSGIEKLFSDYNSRIIVLYMPNQLNEQPEGALKKALSDHPDIIFVDGMQAINKYGISSRDYQGRHPQPPAHEAYAREIVSRIRAQI